jgi:hypothetical protein
VILDLLSGIGADIHRHQSDPNEVTICCPFCEERGESKDARFRLGINIGSGIGHCYNCHWKSGSLAFTVRALCQSAGIQWRHYLREGVEPASAPDSVEEVPIPVGLPPEYEQFRKGGDDEIELRAVAYLVSRGVTRLQIKRHKIGYAAVGDYAWRVLFPVLGKDTHIYGCVGRDFSGHGKPKYKNTPGIKLLWNGHRTSSMAILTEGVMDALSVERVIMDENLPAVVVSHLGTAITKYQIEQLLQYEEVIDIPDWDLPGVKGAITRGQILSDHRIKVRVAVPEKMNDSDPGSMSADLIVSLIERALPWGRHAERRLRASAMKS